MASILRLFAPVSFLNPHCGGLGALSPTELDRHEQMAVHQETY
jgi:hypothetical protein